MVILRKYPRICLMRLKPQKFSYDSWYVDQYLNPGSTE